MDREWEEGDPEGLLDGKSWFLPVFCCWFSRRWKEAHAPMGPARLPTFPLWDAFLPGGKNPNQKMALLESGQVLLWGAVRCCARGGDGDETSKPQQVPSSPACAAVPAVPLWCSVLPRQEVGVKWDLHI